VDNNPGFTSPEIEATKTGSYHTPGFSLAAGTYYWRVRASNSSGDGPWSAVWGVTVLSTPGTPSQYAPPHGDTIDDSTPLFDWSSVSDAESYRIQIDNNPDFGSREIDTTTPGPSYIPSNGLPDGTYYWRVRAINSCGGGPWSTARMFEIDTSVTFPTIQLIGLEVTQAIQDWENAVVLIRDKATFVRAHVKSTSGSVPSVTAQLVGKRNGSDLPGSPLAPANTGGTITVVEQPSRNQINDSFYFQLPFSWRNGTVDLEVRVTEHPFECRERTGTDNDCRAQVEFVESPSIEVQLVKVVWRGNGVRHEPSTEDIARVVNEIESQ
jgi:hypothetical protein